MAEYAERRRPDGSFRVGLHVKSLRASMDVHSVLPPLLAAVHELPDAVLQVNGHRDVLEPGGARYDAELSHYLRAAQYAGRVDLRVHDFLDDAALWDYLDTLDVSVLPYRFGTHSGWLEACRDLGVAVVAPTCGYYADQGPVHSFVLEESAFDPSSLRDAVRAAYEEWRTGGPDPLTVDFRRRQRQDVAQAHRELYEALR